MEDSFKSALGYSHDEWGFTGYILNEKTSPTFNPKRTYSDMTTSMHRYSQGGTFLPSEQDGKNGDGGEENDEDKVQPPRNRRRID